MHAVELLTLCVVVTSQKSIHWPSEILVALLSLLLIDRLVPFHTYSVSLLRSHPESVSSELAVVDQLTPRFVIHQTFGLGHCASIASPTRPAASCPLVLWAACASRFALTPAIFWLQSTIHGSRNCAFIGVRRSSVAAESTCWSP